MLNAAFAAAAWVRGAASCFNDANTISAPRRLNRKLCAPRPQRPKAWPLSPHPPSLAFSLIWHKWRRSSQSIYVLLRLQLQKRANTVEPVTERHPVSGVTAAANRPRSTRPICPLSRIFSVCLVCVCVCCCFFKSSAQLKQWQTNG